MNAQKFTLKAQETLQTAQNMVLAESQQSIEPIHILHALLQTDKDYLQMIAGRLSVNLERLGEISKIEINRLGKTQGGEPYFSTEASRVLAIADKKMGEFKDSYISNEHILLGLVETKSLAAQLLKDAGITSKEAEKVILEMRKGNTLKTDTGENTFNSLQTYAVNLNQRAKEGKLDPVIGRDEEIRRILQILSRRTKNNPILIGEPGVGKTAIAEGLAHRIIRGDVPENLKSKIVFNLDLGALVAGAKYKGEFEERLKAVIKEVISSDGEVVLFIDEIHTLVGAGRSEGAMDAANILKPALARGELRAIGATTLAEYQKYIETDKALERRFQTVYVDEPNTEEAISILRGLKERYETHHKVRIKDEAIISSVQMSQRYISDRFLPDKAIDLLDEAASKLRLEMNSVPEELDELNRKIMQLEIEREAIKRENDLDKLALLNEKIANLQDEQKTFKAQWENEKKLVDQIQQKKQDIEKFKQEADQAERDGDYGRVAELRYGIIKKAEEDLYALTIKMGESSHTLVKQEVDAQDIAEIISKWTGIPVSKMLQSEREKLLHLEDELHKRVIGQHGAIEGVANAIRRSRAGLQDPNKPIGSFIFLGTTGVGKTEVAKTLAKYLFDTEDALVRIDMSEYQEKHTVSRLVGAPPGYVGYDEGGQLTEAIRRRPYSVVLLDEIEKAHPDVFNILLQVLDDGRLTDNKGRTANFKNTIIIMTSNLGSDIIQQNYELLGQKDHDEILSKTQNQVYQLLRNTIRPEFLNRVDEISMFEPLDRAAIMQIAELQLGIIEERLAENKIKLTISNTSMEWLAQLGYDPQFGARPLKRVIQKHILDELSKLLLVGKIKPGDAIEINGQTPFSFEIIKAKSS